MSSTELYRVKLNGDVEWVTDFRNSHGGAMMIWHALHQEYLKAPFPLMDVSPDFWKLSESSRLTWFEKNCLISTFDWVIVKAEDLRLLSVSFRAFADRYQRKDRACSLRDQADTIDGLKEIVGVCWNQTSVCENPWQVESVCVTCGNPDDEDARPWNIEKDTNDWFAELTPEPTKT